METVDKPSELQMELMSLSEPTNTEAPGGKPEEASTDISGENPNEASADSLNEKAASTYAETSRGMPAKASAVILGGKPAEDEHILLLIEGTKKTLTAGRVAYYVFCVLIVVAVWSVALLPSVLTFSILRSPVQAPLAEAYTVNLTNTTPNCSIYTEDTDSSRSEILPSNWSILAVESSSRNYNATAGLNCSRNCSEGFYLHQELGSCRPKCGVWEINATSSTTEFIVIVKITSLCFTASFTIVVLVISALQWKTFTLPSFFLVFMLFDVLAIVLLIILENTQIWFCSSVDFIDSVLNPSPFCTLSGFLNSYIARQFSLWPIFYVALLFWAVASPFHYQTFKNGGRLKYIYTAMIIAGVLLPCVPAVINVAFGYGIVTFSPMRCEVAVQDVGFYTEALAEGFEVAILGTLQALIILKLMKHAVKKTKEGNKVYMILSWAQRKILGFLLLALVMGCLSSALSAYVSATVNSRRRVLQDYLHCEATGSHAECNTNQVANELQTRGLQTAIFVGVVLFPVILLPFIVDVQELKMSCKHICSFLRAFCVSRQ